MFNRRTAEHIEELYAVENRTETQERVLQTLRENEAASRRTDALDRAWREQD
jgi:hypothetical protein